MKDRIHKNFLEVAHAVGLCLEHDLVNPALILIYSSIDAAAWLWSDSEEKSTRKNFEGWVNEFMLPAAGLECTATDLYGARCGLDGRIIVAAPQIDLAEQRMDRCEPGIEHLCLLCQVKGAVQVGRISAPTMLPPLHVDPAEADQGIGIVWIHLDQLREQPFCLGVGVLCWLTESLARTQGQFTSGERRRRRSTHLRR